MADPSPNAAQIFAAKFHNTLQPILATNPQLSISISWCPSHCKIKGNDRADALAKKATQKESQAPYNLSQANAARRSKSSILKIWRKEWKNQPKTGRYAVSNQIPPSLNPTPHFRQLKDNRELFGRLTQCRIGHAYTGEFRRSFLPHSEDPVTCPCDNEILQTREHLLRECTKYSQHRYILQEASETIALPTLLGTKEGIQALIHFLKKTGAFSRTGVPREPHHPPLFENKPDVDSDAEDPYAPEDD